jgi:hypothetical protein
MVMQELTDLGFDYVVFLDGLGRQLAHILYGTVLGDLVHTLADLYQLLLCGASADCQRDHTAC